MRRGLAFRHIPYRIHTNRELGLMLRGEKPLSVFADIHGCWPGCVERYCRMFDRHVALGELLKREYVQCSRGDTVMDLYRLHVIMYALPKEAWRFDAMVGLQLSLWDGARWNAAKERQLGELLGYTDWQNDYWLTNYFSA